MPQHNIFPCHFVENFAPTAQRKGKMPKAILMQIIFEKTGICSIAS